MLSQPSGSSEFIISLKQSKTTDKVHLRGVQFHNELHQGPIRDDGSDSAI